jgi:hypothetical protein
MAEDLMRYDVLVESALRSVVRDALARVAKEGFPGDHHFYITFHTAEPGVVIPTYLHEKYPAEMTIVLQHQFRNLVVDESGFSVSLSFNDISENLRIPFSAVVAFADPTVNFGLQFKFEEQQEEEEEEEEEEVEADADSAPFADLEAEADTPSEEAAGAPNGNVVPLDHFRRK